MNKFLNKDFKQSIKKYMVNGKEYCSLDAQNVKWEDIKNDKSLLDGVNWVQTSAYDEGSTQKIYTAIVSTLYMDKDKECINPKGLAPTEIVNNPGVVIYNHSWMGTDCFPIGKVVAVGTKDEYLFMKYFFDETDPFAQKVREKIDKGYFKYSIGFYDAVYGEITSTNKDKNPSFGGNFIDKGKLLELSIVIIPSNSLTGTLSTDEMQQFKSFAKSMPQTEKPVENKSSGEAKSDPIIKIIGYKQAEHQECDYIDAVRKTINADNNSDDLYACMQDGAGLFLHHIQAKSETGDILYFTNKGLLDSAMIKILQSDFDLAKRAEMYMHLQKHYQDLQLPCIAFKDKYDEGEIYAFCMGGSDNVEKTYQTAMQDIKTIQEQLLAKMATSAEYLRQIKTKLEINEIEKQFSQSFVKDEPEQPANDELEKKFLDLFK